MSLSVVSFGGRLGFYLQGLFPVFAGKTYYKLQTLLRKRKISQYINRCMSFPPPIIMNIETINRCNGKCSFCPANIKDETRPFKLMDDKLFEKILSELEAINYSGVLSLFVNNEPFLDKRMPDMLKEARKRLPDAEILIQTNGTMLTAEKLNAIANSVDFLLINNYSNSYELTESSKMIYEYIKNNPEVFKNTNVTIDRRYVNAILSNRAGASPNHAETKKVIHDPCILPLTDFTIFSNGVVGICCNDAREKTNYGNLNNQSILDLLRDEKVVELKKAVTQDRSNYSFCKYCDFIDSGARTNYIFNHQLQPKYRSPKKMQK